MNKSYSLPFLIFDKNVLMKSKKKLKLKNNKKIFTPNNFSKKFEKLLLTNYEKNKERIKSLIKNKKINILKVKENLGNSHFYNRKSEIYSILFKKKEPSKELKKNKQRRRIFKSMKLSTKNFFKDNFDIFTQIENFKGKNQKEKYSLLKKIKTHKKSIQNNRRSFKRKITKNNIFAKKKKNLTNFKIKKIDIKILNKPILKNFCNFKINKKLVSKKNIFKNTFSLLEINNNFLTKKKTLLKRNLKKFGKIFMTTIKKSKIKKERNKIFKKKKNNKECKRLLKIEKFMKEEKKNYLIKKLSYKNTKIKNNYFVRIKNRKIVPKKNKRRWMKIINNLLTKSNLRFVNNFGYYKSIMIKVPNELLKSKSIYKNIEILQYKLEKDVKTI